MMGLDLRVPGAKWKQRVGSSVELGLPDYDTLKGGDPNAKPQ